MRFDPTRVRRGGLLGAAGAVVLLILMFAVKWYRPGVLTSGVRYAGSVDGWHGLLHLRWLIVVTIAAALLLGLVSLRPGAPGLRQILVVLVGLLGLATVLWLGYRVLISVPHGEKPAAYIGLGCAVIVLAGAGLAAWDGLRPTGSAPSVHSGE